MRVLIEVDEKVLSLEDYLELVKSDDNALRALIAESQKMNFESYLKRRELLRSELSAAKKPEEKFK